MLHFRKICVRLLLIAIVVLPHSVYAHPEPTYDLDSLCYRSTDVVEATIVRHHTPEHEMWTDTFTATVAKTLEGSYKRGDQIKALSLDGFDPARTGQRCILFIARKEFRFDAEPSLPIAPQITDMLLIDSQNRVRRYFQRMNPGGLVAQGYIDDVLEDTATKKEGVVTFQMGPRQEEDSEEHAYPSLAAERSIIAAKWMTISRLRPLLSHDPRPEDVPILLNLLRYRSVSRPPYLPILTDGIAETICSRLADLENPTVALDALSTTEGEKAGWRSGLETKPFTSLANFAYAQSIAQYPRQPQARRAAAAEVLRYNAPKLPLKE